MTADVGPPPGTQAPGAHADDPRPVSPEAPLPTDCCESGCAVCVYDLYAEELADYRQRLAAWTARQPAA